MRSRRNAATRSRESPSCLGASRATCSISSLKLTAPAFDLDAEDLADDATQETFQACVLKRRQRTNRLILIRFEHRARTILDAALLQQFTKRCAILRTASGGAPQRQRALTLRRRSSLGDECEGQ